MILFNFNQDFANQANSSTNTFQLQLDCQSLLFDENFQCSPKKVKCVHVNLSPNFTVPAENFTLYDKYAFTFYEDLDFLDNYAPLPDEKEFAKLSRKPQKVNVEVTFTKEDFVNHLNNYNAYDPYDALFVEDLEFLDKYANVDFDVNVDNTYLSKVVKEETPLVVAEKVESTKPAVLVAKTAERKFNLDKLLRN